MNKKELMEKRELLQGELQEMLNVAQTETRGLTQDENESYEGKEAELRSVIDELNTIENQKNTEIKGEVKMEKLEVRQLEDAYVKGIATGNMEEYRTLVAGVVGEGNLVMDNTIPKHLMEQIVKKINEVSNVVAEVKQVNAQGEITFFVEKADVSAKLLLENEEIAEDNIADFDTVTLKDRRVGTLVTVTKNLLLNSPIVSEAYIVDKIATRVARALEQQVFKATGTGAEMTKGILVGAPAECKVTTATTNVIATDDIQALITSMKPQFLAGAKFYMNRAVFAVISKLKNTNGDYFLTSDIASATPGYKLFGYPIVITETITDLVATTKTPIVFANMGEAMAMKINQNAQIQVLREKYATRSAVGIMADFFGDVAVINNEAFRHLVIK